MERNKLRLIIESLLFASDAPITLKKFQEIFPEIPPKELQELLSKLQEEYEGLDRSFYLREVAKGYQLCTKSEYSEWIKKLKRARPFRLSKATMETLAIIAYKQPITRAEIEQIRGVDTAGILRALLEKKLIKISGKKDVPGKPLLYSTTPKFLTMFGLKEIKDLPTLEDIEQLEEHPKLVISKKSSGNPEEFPYPQTPVPNDENQS